MSQPSDSQNNVQISLDYRHLKYFAGMFFLVGVGLGLTGLVSIGYFGGAGGIGGAVSTVFFMLITLIIAFSIGPVLGVILANDLTSRFALGENAYLSTFVGGALGYLVMVITVAIILILGIALLFGGGAGNGGQDGTGGAQDGTASTNPISTLLNLLGPMIVFSIPTGLVCVGTVYVNERGVLGSYSTSPQPRQSREPASSGATPSTEASELDISERGEAFTAAISDHFRVTRGFGLGVLAALIVAALVVGIIAIEPFGEGAVPLVPPYTPLNVIRLYSWFILMAHGVTVSGFTLEITRLSLLQAAPIVGMGVAGWVGGKLWGEGSYLLSAVSGSSTVVGYVVFIAALAIIAPARVDPTAPNIQGSMVQVDLLATTFTVGILYPLIVGAVGGAVANIGRGD